MYKVQIHKKQVYLFITFLAFGLNMNVNLKQGDFMKALSMRETNKKQILINEKMT